MGIPTSVRRGVVVAALIGAAHAALANETTFVRGLIGEPTGGFREPWHTHWGFTPLFGVRQQKDCGQIEWKTDVVLADAAGDTVTFVWAGATGLGPANLGYFTISVNGHEAAEFDAVIERTEFPCLAANCRFVYDVLSTYAPPDRKDWPCDSSGFFYLTVPRAWITPGQAATLRVVGKEAGLLTWFALVQADDVPLALPKRSWRTFEKVETVARGTPLPAGEEASYAWYVKQYPDPTALTAIGPPGDPAETAVSPRGQLIAGDDPVPRPIPGTPYVANGLAFALVQDGIVTPLDQVGAVHQSLVEGRLPIVVTRWKGGDIEMQQTAFARPLRGDAYTTGRESTLAWAVFELTNRTDAPREVVLAAAQTGDEKRPQRSMTYENGVVMEQGSARFSALLPPGATAEFLPVFPADAKPDPNNPVALLGQGGIYNALVMKLTLEPGQTQRLCVNRVVDFPKSQCRDADPPKVAPDELLKRDPGKDLENAKSCWESLAKRIARFETPDDVLNRMVAKAMLDGYFLTKRWDGKYIVFDSVCYRCQWDDASTKWFYALDLMGDHKTASRLLDTVFARQGQRKPSGCQTREGCFSDVTNTKQDGSAASWASCNGWALWAMAEHARLTNDRPWLAAHKDQILAGCDWIVRERQLSKQTPDNPCAGLLRGKFVCDMDDQGKPNQGNVSGVGYFTYTDAISHLGLSETARLFCDFGLPEGEQLRREADTYRNDIVAAIDRLTDKSQDPWYVPWVLHAPKYVHKYLLGVCGPINLAFGHVVASDDPRIDHVIRFNVEGMNAGRLEDSATASMFYSQDLACVLLERGRVEDFLRMFYAILAADVSHETFTTGEWGANTQPHVHSISSMVRMFRTMLIQERDGALCLLQGTPRRWLEPGKEIRIADAPTWYGPLSLHAVSGPTGNVHVDLQVPPRLGDAPVRLKLRLPAGRRLGDVTINGQPHRDVEGEWIVLRGVAGHAVIDAATVAE